MLHLIMFPLYQRRCSVSLFSAATSQQMPLNHITCHNAVQHLHIKKYPAAENFDLSDLNLRCSGAPVVTTFQLAPVSKQPLPAG